MVQSLPAGAVNRFVCSGAARYEEALRANPTRPPGAEAVFRVAVFPPSADPKRFRAYSWVTVGDVCLCEPPEGPAAEMMQYGAGHPWRNAYNHAKVV